MVFIQIADRPAPCSLIDDQDIKDVKILSCTCLITQIPNEVDWSLDASYWKTDVLLLFGIVLTP